MGDKRKHCALCKMKRSETKMVRKFNLWFCSNFSVVSGMVCSDHSDVSVLKEIDILKKKLLILNL